jgi:ABC-type multidrug transport system ATPase subunit
LYHLIDSQVNTLSGGMKRRLSIILSTIGDPKVLFLDEPTTGLDPVNKRFIWNIIKKLKKGRSIILTSHSMDEVDFLSDRIGIIIKGELKCIGTSLELKDAYGGQYVLKLGIY